MQKNKFDNKQTPPTQKWKPVKTGALALAISALLAACGGGDSAPQDTASGAKLLADGEACSGAWVSTIAYVGGNKVSYNGVNYTAAYWTQNNVPSTNSGPAGSGKPWITGFKCGGTATSTTTTKANTTTTKGTSTTTKATTTTTGGSSACPAYVAGTAYASGKTVANAGGYYTCDVSGWCSQGASAYEPGVGWAWTSAWHTASAGVCGATSTTTKATTTTTKATTTTTKTTTTTTNASSAVTVDLLVIYDSHSNTYFSNQITTAMKSWVDQMNVMNQNSQVNIRWRLVGVEAHEEAGTAMGDVLSSIRQNAWVLQRRDALGADFVTQIHKSGACGVGYLAVDRNWAFNVVGPTCGPNTMAHELGHTMGLAHSRRQGDTTGTRYAYGLGYGVDNTFATLMAYESSFNTRKVPKYSNPRVTCNGLPCGIAEGNSQQADAAKALNNVRMEVAGFKATQVAATSSPAIVSSVSGVTVYQKNNYTGYSATLVPGEYLLADLVAKGIANNDLSSAKVPSGYILELYSNDHFGGAKNAITKDNAGFLNPGVNNTTSSVIVRNVQ